MDITWLIYVVDALLVGAIGGEGHSLLRKFFKIFAKSEKTVNQNLQWALHHSIILAQKGICNECLDKLDRQDKDTQWLKQKIAFLEEDLKKNDKAKFSGYTTEELSEIESYPILSDALLREREQKVKKELAKYVIIDKEAPECYKEKVNDKLLDYMFFSFVELIQQDAGVHKVFYEQLAVIHKDLREFQTNADKMLSSFYGIKYIILNISDKVDIIEKNTIELKEEMSEIKKIIKHFKIDKIKINRIDKKDIIENFKDQELKFETYCWLIKGLFTVDDVFTKSKDDSIFIKKYIPVWEYSGHYSGRVQATIVIRDENGRPLDTRPFNEQFPKESFNERVTGADISKVLELNPSELGSLWGVASSEANTFLHHINSIEESLSKKNISKYHPKHIFVCISKIIVTKLSLCFEKRAFAFFNHIVEELNEFDHYYQLIEINLGDLSEEKSIEFLEEADLTVTAKEFIVEINERYTKAKESSKKKIIRGTRGRS